MSQENVEVVRAAIDAYNRGGWEAALKDAAPDFELDWSRAIGPLRGVYGREQVRRLGAEFAENFESTRIDPHEFIEAGEHVVVPWTLHVVGRDGIEVQARVTWTWTIRDGAIERACMYQERREARSRRAVVVARYCAGDVAGERGDRQAPLRRLEPPE